MSKWEMVSFGDAIDDVTKKATKIKKEDYLTQGQYYIIDQGKGYLAGYANSPDGLYTDVPAIVFGDHTRIIKYVDRPLFIGADGVKLLKIKSDEFAPKYVYYYLKSCRIIDTGYNRHFKWLKEFDIPQPSLPVQQQIADVLDRASALIEKRKAQIEKMDLLVKSQFIEMFGDPVTNPKGWEKEPLNRNAVLINGRAYSQEELLDKGQYPVLRVGNFFSNKGWYYSDLDLDEDKYCDKGDLLFAWSASFGARIWDGEKVIYHYHIWKIAHSENYNRVFLCKLLDYSVKQLMSSTHGIAMMHLTKSGMESTCFVLPPIELQNKFAAFVQTVEAQKSLLQQSLAKLEQNYKSLMQKCFRGEIF